MTRIIQRKTFSPPEFNEREILRYAGVRDDGKDIKDLLSSCVEEICGKYTLNVCYLQTELDIRANICDFGSFSVSSTSLSEHLKECKNAVIFAATLGLSPDRLISKYSKISPSRALMLDAIFTERIEALCDTFCKSLAETFHITSRFSSGYGDLPIETQKDIFSILDSPRQIGLTLNDSLIMSPSKSVTGIIGIKSKE